MGTAAESACFFHGPGPDGFCSGRLSHHGRGNPPPGHVLRPPGTRAGPSQEVTFNLLSILLGASSDALAVIRTTEELRNKVLAANNSLQQALTEKESLIHELQEALAKVKTLSGLVPICAWCKKIRDDQGFWRQVEVFVQSHSDAVFTHGVCPECRSKFARQPAGLGAPA